MSVLVSVMRSNLPVSISLAACGLILVITAGCGEPAQPAWKPVDKRLVVLGVDGMDPKLVEQYMREGRLPNLKALAAQGTMMPLGTVFPPQSPVAWSAFITGMQAGGHGIYDFVHRDAHDLSLYLSTSRIKPAGTWKLGPWVVPDPFSVPTTELPARRARVLADARGAPGPGHRGPGPGQLSARRVAVQRVDVRHGHARSPGRLRHLPAGHRRP